MLFRSGGDISALGVLFNTDIFPDRSALRSETWILGGGPSMQDPDDIVLDTRVLPDRERLMRTTARPRAFVVTRWPQGIPVYDAAIPAVSALRESTPRWLALAGNYLGRIGASALFDVSFEAAQRLTA